MKKRKIILLIGLLFYLAAFVTRFIFRRFGIIAADTVSFITHGAALVCLGIYAFYSTD